MKKLLLTIGLIAASSAAFAATYQIYSEPNMSAKVVSQLTDQNQAQYIQFYQKGDWIKIADTATGQVGWVNIAQIKQSQIQAQYQEAINTLNMQQKDLDARHQAFEKKYQQAVKNIQDQLKALQQKMSSAVSKAPGSSATVITTKQNAVDTVDHVQRSFNAVKIQTNKDGKTATVTREWLDKDGKMQKEVEQISVSDLQKISLTF